MNSTRFFHKRTQYFNFDPQYIFAIILPNNFMEFCNHILDMIGMSSRVGEGSRLTTRCSLIQISSVAEFSLKATAFLSILYKFIYKIYRQQINKDILSLSAVQFYIYYRKRVCKTGPQNGSKEIEHLWTCAAYFECIWSTFLRQEKNLNSSAISYIVVFDTAASDVWRDSQNNYGDL